MAQGVFKQLKEIASIEGHKSQDHKKGMIMKLLAAATDAEPGFLIRSMQGKLRIGLAEQSVLMALAQSTALEVRHPLGMQASQTFVAASDAWQICRGLRNKMLAS